MIDPMTGRLRALLAALVVVLIAAVGAAYALTRNEAIRAAQNDGSLTVATTGDVRDLINDSNMQSQLLNVALNKLETAYYKPVDPQTPPKGEAKALGDFLKSKHIENASIPDSGDVS